MEKCGHGVVDASNIFTPLFPYPLVAPFVENGKYDDPEVDIPVISFWASYIFDRFHPGPHARV